MRNSWVMRALCYVMMVVFPSALLMAESQGAILHPSGSVKVNGKSMTRAVALFAGDSVQTAASGVTISAPGSTVYVPGKSAVTFQGGSVGLSDGSVVVTTSRRLAAEVSGFTVTPVEAAPARFEIAQLGGRIQVAAHEGALAIRRGTDTMHLEAGSAAVYDPAAVPSAPAPAASAAAAGAAWVVIPLVVAGVAAVTAYVSTRNSPVTNPVP